MNQKTGYRKMPSALALVLVIALVLPWAAFADQVANNIDTTVDPDLETRAISVGGSTIVGFFISPSNTIPAGDATGCNATGNAPATVTLSIPSGVGASATTLTFVGCGTQYVTLSSSTAGSYLISVLSVTGGKSGSLWDTAPAAFTLIVNPAGDTTPPVITPTVSGILGESNWYVTDVTVSWTVIDNESDITSKLDCDSTTIDADTTGITLTCSATSAGGTDSQSVTIKRDATAPTFGDCPAADPFLLNSGSQSVGPIGVDASISGLDAGLSTLSGSVDTSSVGTKIVTFSATDNAGNSATNKNCSYSVVYDWTGFFRPVDDLPTFNVVKAGSAIPVKFSLSGNQGLSIFVAGYPGSKVIGCPTSALLDSIEETVTAGNSSLSYDPVVDQYVYVWKTDKAWSNTCRQLIVRLTDGTEHSANFKFSK